MPIQKLETTNVLKQWMDTINTIIDDSSELESHLNEKVDKETGKGLSTNDFTNTLKDKLDSIEEGANNYTLPTANNATKGGVTLSDSTSSEFGVDDGIAATPKAVKIAYDLASKALPKAGGTIEGDLTVTGKINATIEGNTDTANKLSVARTIALTGDVTGSTTFDGSKDVSITVTVADDSHNHTIENIDNLETLLATKAGTTSPTFVGTPKAPTATVGTNTTQIATTAFVQSAIDSKIATADAMIFKGTIGTNGTVTALPAEHSIGWTYKVATVGIYAGVNCEVGDMIVCLADGTTANDADWTVIQTNIDGAVTGPASAVEERIAVFSGTTGKIIKDSGFTISTSVPADAKFTDTTYSAENGISLTGTTFSNSGVRSVSSGTANGTISVNTNGTSADVAVKGLGTAAFTETTAYTEVAHKSVVASNDIIGHVKLSDDINSNSGVAQGVAATPAAVKSAYDLANAALPKTGGTITGDLTVTGKINASIEGVADTALSADKLSNARTVALTGDVTGSATFDGSEDISISVTVADDSHSHTIDNIDNLETLLASKAGITSPTFTGTPKAPTATAGTNNTQIATTAFVSNAVELAVEGTVYGPSESTDSAVAVFDGITGDLLKDSGYTIASSVPVDAKFTDTTYTGTDGITLTGTTFSNSGVRSISSGATNGTISVNTNGTSAEVAVKGLGSAAFTNSSDYLPIDGGIITGDLAVDGTLTATIEGNASSADVLTVSDTGNATTPVYFEGGIPVAISHTIASSVPANAKFTDTTYTVGTTNYSGTTKLYTSVGDNTDGTINQYALTTILSGKLGATDTAVRATSDANGNNIASTYATKEELENIGDSLADVATSGSYNDLTDKPTSLKNPTSLTIQNSAGTSVGSYDGSTATTVKLTSDTVGLGNVTNESKATMFTSPALTGTPTAPTATSETNTTQIATTAFVQSVVDSKIAASDAMIFKGTIGTSGTVSELPATHSTGWTYKVITAGTYAGVKCNVGDMIICLTDGTTANDEHWSVVEGNIDGAVTGPASSVANNVAIFDGATGKVIKDSGFSIASSVPANAKFTDTTYTGSDGITLTGTNFTNSGVRSVSSGATNGTISVNTNGTDEEIAVKGLGSAAFTESSAYAPDSHILEAANGSTLGHVKLSDSVSSTSGVTGGFAATPAAVKTAYDLANAALPKAGGTITGDLTVEGVFEASVSNAATADKLTSAGTITLAGDASGSVAFDGSDATLTVTIADDSHNHTVENIDNLETLLASKSAIASPTFTGSPKAPTAAAGTNTTQIATTAFVTTAVANKTSVSGNAGTATTLKTARTIDGVSFNGSAAITHFGTCSTESATAAKTVACTGFTLVTGAEITVQFTVTNTAANPTLNVNSTGAKAIVYRNAAITAGNLAANRCYRFVYDGTNYELVGDINTDTNTKVTQTVSTTNAELPILGKSAIATTTTTDTTKFCAGVTLNPSTGTITATTFKGYLNGNASTATTLTTARTIGISGGATGTATAFDGSGNITIPVTALDVSKATAGTLPIARGGTGSSTKNFVDLSSNQTVAGTKTFSGAITKSISNYGTANTVLQVASGSNTSPVIQISEPVEGQKNGKVVCIGSKGATIIGSGESPASCLTELIANTSENTYIVADSSIYFYTGANTYANKKTASIDASGNFTATAVYNAVWNDYAEFFPRGEETEAGDFIALSLDSDNEVYVKATKETSKSVGIHSDSFGHLIGGEDAPDGQDFVEYNLPKYIPVGLVGRVRANIVGEVKKGDFIVISDIPGVGRAFNKETDSYVDIIGMACESSSEKDIKRIKVKLGN